MISAKEYEVLSFIKNKQRFQTKPYMEEIRTLLAEDFISLCNPTLNGINEYTYQGCFVTAKGNRAHRDYEEHQKELLKSNVSFWISIVSIALALGSFLISIFKP